MIAGIYVHVSQLYLNVHLSGHSTCFVWSKTVKLLAPVRLQIGVLSLHSQSASSNVSQVQTHPAKSLCPLIILQVVALIFGSGLFHVRTGGVPAIISGVSSYYVTFKNHAISDHLHSLLHRFVDPKLSV